MNVSCRFGLSNIVIEREHTLTLMLRIEAPPAPKQSDRKPLNLALVLDRSGSMAGEKLEHVKAAATHLIRHLKPTDSLALIAYATRVDVLAPARPVGDKRDLLRLVDQMQSEDTTNLSGGWLAGLAQLQRGTNGSSVNRVLLMTDGLANEGVTDPADLRRIGGEYRGRGISTTTLGFGADFDERLLRGIAESAGGAFYFISSPEAAPGIFAEELGELLSVVGQNLVTELRVEAPARVLTILNEYPSEPIDGGFRIHVGDLFGDEQREIVAEVLVPGLRQLGPHRVGSILVDLDQVIEPITHHRFELPIEINAVTPDHAQPAPDPEVESTADLLRVNALRRRLIDLIRNGEIALAESELAKARSAFESRGSLGVEQVRELERLQREIAEAIEERSQGLKRMEYQAYAMSARKAEYRRKHFSRGPVADTSGMQGLVQVLPVTREIEATLLSFGDTWQEALEACRIRLSIETGYWSIIYKLLGGRNMPQVLPPDLEANLYRELYNSAAGGIRLAIGPWEFADGRFSHWYADGELALVAARGFESLTNLPLSAFLAYEMLLHGLRVYPGFDPDQLMHEEARGCLLDLCRDKQEIRRKLLGGTLCDDCRGRLEPLGIPLDEVRWCMAEIARLAGA